MQSWVFQIILLIEEFGFLFDCVFFFFIVYEVSLGVGFQVWIFIVFQEDDGGILFRGYVEVWDWLVCDDFEDVDIWVVGVVIVWSVFQYFYFYFDVVDVDWDWVFSSVFSEVLGVVDVVDQFFVL